VDELPDQISTRPPVIRQNQHRCLPQARAGRHGFTSRSPHLRTDPAGTSLWPASMSRAEPPNEGSI
jgi:hypothetical protein